MVVLTGSTSATAVQYFNAPFGFVNETRDVDYLVSLDAVFPNIDVSGTDLLLQPEDIINDTLDQIDRTVTWTVVNNYADPESIGPILLFLTALRLEPGDHDYSSSIIDIDIDGATPGTDRMVVARYGPYDMAGYYFEPSDFVLGGDGLRTVQRTFRYTVNEGEAASGPPDLGVAYVTEFAVPEPATGTLLGMALAVGVLAGRRRR